MAPIRILGTFLLCAITAGPGIARPSPATAEAVVAAAKQATGAKAWDRPQGCTERGTHGDGAITYLTRFSLRGYGMRTDSDRGGTMRSMGFDGKTRWQRTGDGAVGARTDPASLREGIVTNYLSINGFFFPDRFPASFKYRRSATEATRRFDVIEISPKGGRPLEIWFDHRTHLIQRVIDIHGTPVIRVEAGDYRRGASGLMVAHMLEVFGPDGGLMDRGRVTAFQCGAIDRAIFTPPTAG